MSNVVEVVLKVSLEIDGEIDEKDAIYVANVLAGRTRKTGSFSLFLYGRNKMLDVHPQQTQVIEVKRI